MRNHSGSSKLTLELKIQNQWFVSVCLYVCLCRRVYTPVCVIVCYVYVCMLICMCVFVYARVYMLVCICMWKADIPEELPTLFLRYVLSSQLGQLGSMLQGFTPLSLLPLSLGFQAHTL